MSGQGQRVTVPPVTPREASIAGRLFDLTDAVAIGKFFKKFFRWKVQPLVDVPNRARGGN